MNKFSDMMASSGVVPPQPGTSVPYQCTKCKATFSHKIPLLDLGVVRCPHCGSIATKANDIRCW